MKNILHSVSYAGLWRGQKFLTLEEFIAKAKALGYEGVELMAKRPHASPLDMSAGRRRDIRRQLEDTGLECACIAGYTDFASGMGESLIPITEMQIAHVTDLAVLAHDLGCKLVRIFTGYENKKVSYWQQWDACVKSIKECCKRASEYGVTIGIQNHHDIAVDAFSLRDFIDEVDEENCKAMFDAWSSAANGYDLKEAVEAIADKIVYTTVADYKQMPRYNYKSALVSYEQDTGLLRAVPVGDGFIDYKKFFNALKAKGFDGYVAYEMCSQLKGGGSEENLDSYAKRFIQYMKSI